MKGETNSGHRKPPSPLFSKTAREWVLSSALYDGIEDEDIRQIETLLSERGANPNTLLPEYGIAPFHLVVANESNRFAVQATDICLQHGADPNVRSEDGLTPVHLAAMWGCHEVLQVLLASGGDPWLVDCFDMNAFNYALKESQDECYKVLNACCNSQPKPSSHSKSPYHLNLKRVVLYKNDLQIVYEASPTSSQKSASTQTSPTNLKDEPEKDSQSKSFGSKISKSSHADKKSNEQVSYLSQHTKHNGTNTNKHTDEKCKAVSSNIYDRSILSSRLKETIINHRRNSTTFEYPPPAEDTDKSNNSVSLGGENNIDNVSAMSNIVSELIKKLENTNKLRQSLKVSGSRHDMLNNITTRKKRTQQVTCSSKGKELKSIKESSYSLHSHSEFDFINDNTSKNVESSVEKALQESLHERKIGFLLNDSVANSSSKLLVDESSKYELPENEIGFVLNDSVASSTILLRRSKITPESSPPSPPSIGFILDKLDETVPNTRGSSLFSDIDSDVDSPAQNKYDNNIFTEDDSLFGQSVRNKYSSSGTLDPYVSCVTRDTREWSSKEEHFESCLDTSPHTGESVLSNSNENKSVNSPSKFDCSLYNDKEGTPVNTKLATSTPERLSAGGSVFLFPTEKDSKGDKRSWVEATIVSSSSDEKHYMSVSEEYEYTDFDEGVVLIERRYLINDINVVNDLKKGNPKLHSSTSELSDVSTISRSEVMYDTDELRQELKAHGFTPGPINGSTKRVYLRKLKRFRQKPDPLPRIGKPAYSPELLGTLNAPCEHKLLEWAHLEDSMSASIACARRPWREGQAKTSFTYLLLDPRVAQSLPARAHREPHSQLWSDFLQAVFYVGKGKRSRPYAHLYSAVAFWKQQHYTNSKKIQKIIEIWSSDQGVVCLHIFLNIIPVEAYTREAAMISALTLGSLTNEKAGEFYGSAAYWNSRQKCRLGCVLLHRAFKVFLAEGERQLRPADIE